ncbi:MAG: ABC transporter substrate-binding protein [Deltaproteobacteria bacterium]|nr:ABC transporter substrate-binding protein [Candidatus Tectomicrobia bacterium]MBI2372097.1 ABC transporter substrate-binding protein [Deltaproteobacteria bacterium]
MRRRDFLKAGLVGTASLLGAGALGPGEGGAAPAAKRLTKPIRIGGQAVMSGPLGGYGQFMRMGAQLAVEEINRAGGILGAKIEIEFRDEELKPDVAVRNARYFVDVWKADFLIGIDSSSVALAVGAIMPQLDRVLVVTHAATEKLNEQLVFKQGIRQVFRISVPVYQDGILSAMIARDFPVRTWATISPDYEYGHTSWKMFRETLKRFRPDVEFVAESFAKFGTVDFGPHISKVMAVRPEAIFSTEWGGEAVALVKQAKLFGVFQNTKAWMCGMGAAMDVLEGLGKDYPEGAWVSCRYWFQYPNTAENRRFVSRFRERWQKYPHYVSETSYSAVYALKGAVEKSGSIETAAVAKALEGMTLTTPAGKRHIRAEDHQAVYEVPWGRITHDRNYPFPILTDLRVVPADQYYRHPPFA